MLFKRLLERWDESRLYARFEREPTTGNLERILSASLRDGVPLRVENSSFRSSVAQIRKWPLDSGLIEHLLSKWVEHLVSSSESSPSDWKVLLDVHSALKKDLQITSPAILSGLTKALEDDEEHGILSRDCLLRIRDTLARTALSQVATESGGTTTNTFRAISILTSTLFDSPKQEVIHAVRAWWDKLPIRPRALSAIDNDRALDCPLSGVSSPNGVAVTYLHAEGNSTPAQIVTAGRTPDPVINSWFDDAIFASALACTNEPTILSENGSILSTSPMPSALTGENSPPLLLAEVGPGGPIEPTGKSAALGLTAQEALLVTNEVFQRIESSNFAKNSKI